MKASELKDIRFLKLEIARTDKALKALAYSGKSGKAYAELLRQTQEELYNKKIEIETLIGEIPDTEIRLILKLKFVDLKSWNYVARIMNYDRTTVYKKYKKFIQGDEQ